MSDWKEQEGELIPVWEYKAEGDFLEGNLKEVRESDYEGMWNYVLTDANGADWLIWGKAILCNRMKEIKVGDKVRVVYKGEVKTKEGRMAKNFSVFKWE